MKFCGNWVRCQFVDRISRLKDKGQWLAVVNWVINILSFIKAEAFKSAECLFL